MAGRGLWRLLIGVAVLYALLLQPFFASATALPVPGLAGVLCSPEGATHAPDGAPARHDHACCTFAQQAGPLAPPPTRFAEAEPPSGPAVAVAFRPEASIPRTGPPTRHHSARGPPLA